MQKIPITDADELKKLVEKAKITLKHWFGLAKEQLQALGLDSAEDYYGLPLVWFQKVKFDLICCSVKCVYKIVSKCVVIIECSFVATTYNIKIKPLQLYYE